MKKWKIILLWTGVSIGISIAVALFLDAYLNWTTGTRLEQRLTYLREQEGEPICLADLARKPIPPEQNGAIYLLRADDYITAIGKELGDARGGIWGISNKDYNPEEIKKIKDALDAYPKVYPLLEQAVACDEIGSDLDFSQGTKELYRQYFKEFTPIILVIRHTNCYIASRVAMLIYYKQRDEALRSAILLLQLSRRMNCVQLNTNYILSHAMESAALTYINDILQSGPVSDQLRKDLNSELVLSDPSETYKKMLLAEQAFTIDSIRSETLSPWLTFGRRNKIQLKALFMIQEFMNDSSSTPDRVSFNDLELTKPDSKELSDLVGALRIYRTFSFQNLAYVRSLRIINALQKQGVSNTDKVPTMAELNLPDEVGIDPFNGKPMIIKKLPEGWLVYSVGKNLKDDGGKCEVIQHEFLDFGFGPKLPKPESKEKEPPAENQVGPTATPDQSPAETPPKSPEGQRR